MGNYLRIYKNLEEFKANTFNLPYPCVSVVDDDTIETDEEIVEFEELDKIKCKLEIPSDVVNGKEEVQVAKFNNLSSVEAYSTNADHVVFVDVPKLIETEKEIQFTLYNGIYVPSYEDSVLCASLTYEMRWKASRQINKTDYLLLAMYDAITGDIGDYIPLQYNDFIKMFVHHGNNEYGFTQEALNEITNSDNAAYIAYSLAFVDAEFVENKGVELPKSITTTFPTKEYEGKYVATEITEFSSFEYSGRTVSLPSIDYAQPISSITTKNRWSVNRELIDTDYCVLVLYADSSTVNLMPIPSSGINDSVYIISYGNLEYGLSQPIINELRTIVQEFPSASINLYFVDKDCYDSMLSNQPTTINTSVITYVIDGGLTSIKVKTNELDENGGAELNLKVTNDFDNISFVNKQYLKSFDGSRYGLNNIKEIANNQFESCGKLEEFIIPNGVETIGDFAFNNCFSLSSVTIPESVTEIGAKAFRKCVFLSENFINQSSLDAEANNYWRANIYDVIQEDGLCIRGTSVWGCRPNSSGVTIPDYITRIEENAFIGCTNLKRVDMPNSIKYIGKNAFRYCINVENIIIPESVEEIASDAFTYCFFDLDVFENKSNINAKENNYWKAVICKDGCVSCCGVLLYIDGENIIIHDGVKVINADAVRNRETIKSITIPSSVTSIGDSTFNGCTSLTSVTIGSSVTSIGNNAFSGCTSLTSVTIPNSVTSIGEQAFQFCTSLTSVTIHSSVTSIGSDAFYGCYFHRDNFIYNGHLDAEFNNWWGATLYDTVQEDGLCINGTTVVKCKPNATNVTIPNGVTSIGYGAFSGCTSLASVTIPSSLTTICVRAYYGCSSLTSVTIPDSVTSIGDMAFYGCSGLTSVTIPSSVTTIGDYAFNSCASLTSVTIPDSVTSIGERAFAYCSGLISVTIPSSLTTFGVRVFQKCTSLTCVIILDGVTTIGDYAFNSCASLTSVTIPDSVTSIGRYAFYGCSSLSSVTIPDSVTSIGNAVFWGCTSLTSIPICRGVNKIGMWSFQDCTSLTSVTIPDNITYINNRAFYGCSSLTSVTILDSVTSIGRYAFGECLSLTSITIPDSVTSIGSSAFTNCSSLTSITIPNSVTSIGSDAFKGCYFERKKFIKPNSLTSSTNWGATLCETIQDDGLCISGTTVVDCRPNATSVTIGSGVTSIGSSAFTNCSSLTSVTIPDSVASIGANAFLGCYFERDNFSQNSSLGGYPWGATLYDTIQDDGLCISGTTAVDCRPNATNVTIPDSVTSIGDSSFSGCKSLTSVVIPDSVTSICASAFRNCSSLTSITIPNSVTSIGEYAFLDCTSLTSVTIPSSVTNIDSYAFYGCSGLTSVTIGSGVTRISDYAFNGCSSLTSITIPDSVTSIDYYAFNGCSSLSSITIPDSVTSIGNCAFDGTKFYNNFPNGDVYLGGFYYKYKGAMPINTSITIKDGTNGIADYAFNGCSGLTSVVIPSSVKSIDSGAFYGCYFERNKFINYSLATGYPWNAKIYDTVQDDGLCISGTTAVDCKENATNVTIPDSVTSIGDSSFSGCKSLTSVVIPDSVTSISSYAFYNCSGLTSVTIPDSVTSIGNSAFNGCSSLTSVTIPNSVTSIGNSAFNGCSSLTSVTIPNSVTSINSAAFYYCSSLTSVTIPSSVTSIGSEAFRLCGSLTSITIPDSVTSIYNNAFSGCYFEHDNFINNSSVSDYPWGATLYDAIQDDGLCINGTTAVNCRPNATSVTIGSGVTSVGSSAFTNCTSLTSVTIPNSVTSIGRGAFTSCTSLTSVTIPNSVTSIDFETFHGCTSLKSVVIPDSVTSINSAAFYYCSSLTSVTIPSSVTSIGSQVFYNCTSLTSITIPSSVTNISPNAFQDCYFEHDNFINNSSLTSYYPWGATLCENIQDDGLYISGTTVVDCKPNATNVTIPSSVTSIGASAFSYCSNLTSVTIPSSVTSIGASAFTYCSSLTSITIPSSVTSIGDNAFYGCTSLNGDVAPNGFVYFGKHLYKYVTPNINNQITSIRFGCTSLNDGCLRSNNYFKTIDIPSSVTSISDNAFYGCSSLTSVTIPDSVTSIGRYAFKGCSNLDKVVIGDGVITIGYGAFSDCKNLDKVVIGGGVKTIGVDAFSDCTQLDEIDIKEGVESIDSYAFYKCQLGSITLPSTIKSVDNTSFGGCVFLQEIICKATIAPTVDGSSFSGLPKNGTLYVPHGSDYKSWKSRLPSGWVIKYLYEPTECTNLVITANDVNGNQTNTQISYTATTNGIHQITHEVMNDVIVTGVTTSQPFEQNTSHTDTIEREITFEYFGVTASTKITQGVWHDASYAIDLQDQWRMSSAVTNPDSNLYDGVYESFSNYNVNSSSATCVITIDGYSNFKFYIRSYGQTYYDYVNVYDLDGSTTIKATTNGKSNSGTTLSSYTLVKFTNLDFGEHTIKIVYSKDSSGNSGTDRGYLMIPYNQD